MESCFPGIFKEIREKKEISESLRAQMDRAITEGKTEFQEKQKAAA